MITISETKLDEARLLLSHIPNAFPRAASNAINRAAEGARTEAVKQVQKMYVIKPGRVRETMDIRKASPANLHASVRSKGRPRALSYFNVRPSKPLQRRKSDPLFAQVKRGEGGTIKGAFVARLKSGHVGVFHRAGAKSLPIIQRYGPSVAQMMGHPSVVKHVEDVASQRLNERLDHEVGRILKGAVK